MRTLSAAKPLIFEDKTIIPIEETTVYGNSVFNNCFIFGSKKPSALIVLSDGNTKAFNMKFEEVPVENLILKIDGLKELINNFL